MGVEERPLTQLNRLEPTILFNLLLSNPLVSAKFSKVKTAISLPTDNVNAITMSSTCNAWMARLYTGSLAKFDPSERQVRQLLLQDIQWIRKLPKELQADVCSMRQLLPFELTCRRHPNVAKMVGQYCATKVRSELLGWAHIDGPRSIPFVLAPPAAGKSWACRKYGWADGDSVLITLGLRGVGLDATDEQRLERTQLHTQILLNWASAHQRVVAYAGDVRNSEIPPNLTLTYVLPTAVEYAKRLHMRALSADNNALFTGWYESWCVFVPKLLKKARMEGSAVPGLVSDFDKVLYPAWAVKHTTAISDSDDWHKLASGRAALKTNLYLSDVLQMYKPYSIRNAADHRWLASIITDMRCGNDWTNAASASWALCFIANPAARRIHADVWSKFTLFKYPQMQALKAMKELHTIIRYTSVWVDGTVLSHDDLACCQYLDSLFNRSELYKYSPSDEILMRVHPGPIQSVPSRQKDGRLRLPSRMHSNWNDELLDVLRKQQRSLLAGRTYRHPTFEEWWHSRSVWASGGSGAGFKLEVYENDMRVTAIRGSKRMALEYMNEDDFWDVVTTMQPVLHSRNAVKLEAGKNRALWNTSIMTFMIASYILEPTERLLTGEKWNAAPQKTGEQIHAILNRITAMRATDRISFMWDYADFNIQHTLDAQGLLWLAHTEAIQAVNTNRAADALLTRCCRWLVRAHSTTIMEDVNNKFIATVSRSLMTGSRGTSFTNTSLNGANKELINRAALRMGCKTGIMEPYYGQGDDIFACVADYVSGVVLTGLINWMGLAGQTVKVLIGSARGEFLRLQYSGQPGSRAVVGFLNRCITGTINGEFKNLALNDPYERARSIMDQLVTLRVRQCNVTVLPFIEDALLRRKCMLRANIGQALAATLGITGGDYTVIPDKRILHAMSSCGGAGVPYADGKFAPWFVTNMRWPKLRIAKNFVAAVSSQHDKSLHHALVDVGVAPIEADRALTQVTSSRLFGSLPAEIATDLLYTLTGDYIVAHRDVRVERLERRTQLALHAAYILPDAVRAHASAFILTRYYARQTPRNLFGALAEVARDTKYLHMPVLLAALNAMPSSQHAWSHLLAITRNDARLRVQILKSFTLQMGWGLAAALRYISGGITLNAPLVYPCKELSSYCRMHAIEYTELYRYGYANYDRWPTVITALETVMLNALLTTDPIWADVSTL
jgi:hypothetical protein